MTQLNPLDPIGERSTTIVAASYPDRTEAEAAAAKLVNQDPSLEGEVSIVKPGDPQAARKLEPDSRGIWRTLVRSHVMLGVAGAGFGLLVGFLFIASPWAAASLSPGYTLLFASVMGAFIGGMLAGLVTLRPDHSPVIHKVHEDSRKGRWSVVARPLDQASATKAHKGIEQTGSEASRSI